MIPLSWYLLLAAALFCIGIYGVFARRNAVAILMAVELMLNAVNINLVAFWRYLTPEQIVGHGLGCVCADRGCGRSGRWPGVDYFYLSQPRFGYR